MARTGETRSPALRPARDEAGGERVRTSGLWLQGGATNRFRPIGAWPRSSAVEAGHTPRSTTPCSSRAILEPTRRTSSPGYERSPKHGRPARRASRRSRPAMARAAARRLCGRRPAQTDPRTRSACRGAGAPAFPSVPWPGAGQAGGTRSCRATPGPSPAACRESDAATQRLRERFAVSSAATAESEVSPRNHRSRRQA